MDENAKIQSNAGKNLGKANELKQPSRKLSEIISEEH
jgi:hypothetical protein